MNCRMVLILAGIAFVIGCDEQAVDALPSDTSLTDLGATTDTRTAPMPCVLATSECDEETRMLANDVRSLAVARSGDSVWAFAAQDPDPILHHFDATDGFLATGSSPVLGTPTDIIIWDMAARSDAVAAVIETDDRLEILMLSSDGEITDRTFTDPTLTTPGCIVMTSQGMVIAGSDVNGNTVIQSLTNALESRSTIELNAVAFPTCAADGDDVRLALIDQGREIIAYDLVDDALVELSRIPIDDTVFQVEWVRDRIMALFGDRLFIFELGGSHQELALPCLAERASAPRMSVAAVEGGIAVALWWDSAEGPSGTLGYVADDGEVVWTTAPGTLSHFPFAVGEGPLHGMFYRRQDTAAPNSTLTFFGNTCQ